MTDKKLDPAELLRQREANRLAEQALKLKKDLRKEEEDYLKLRNKGLDFGKKELDQEKKLGAESRKRADLEKKNWNLQKAHLLEQINYYDKLKTKLKDIKMNMPSLAMGGITGAGKFALAGVKLELQRVQQGVDQYLRSQGELGITAVKTSKAISTIGNTFSKLQQNQMGGLQVGITDAVTTIGKNVGEAAKSALELGKDIASQWMQMDIQAGKLAIVYGKSLDEVRGTQLDVIAGLGDIRLSTDTTRVGIENVTSSLMFLEKTGVLPLAEGIDAMSSMSQQFGSGTVKAAVESTKALETLARIPDLISSRIEKAEGRVVRFSATNRKDFMKSVMDLNKQYGHQNTVLKAIGSTFAGLAVEARKYGAAADTATEVAQGFSGALLSNSEDTITSMQSGMRLAQLLGSPEGLAKIQEGMSTEQLERFKEMLPTIMEEAKEGSAIAFSDISNMLSGTMQDVFGRLQSIKQMAGTGLTLSTSQRVMQSLGVNTKTPEGRAIAAKLLRSNTEADLMKIVNSVMKERETGEKAVAAKKGEKEAAITGLGPTANIGNTLTNIEKYLEMELGKKLIDFTGEAIGWIQKNPKTAAVGGAAGAVGLTAAFVLGGKLISESIKKALGLGAKQIGVAMGEVGEAASKAVPGLKTAGKFGKMAGLKLIQPVLEIGSIGYHGYKGMPGEEELPLEERVSKGVKYGIGRGVASAFGFRELSSVLLDLTSGTKEYSTALEIDKENLGRAFAEGMEPKSSKFVPLTTSINSPVQLPQMNITSRTQKEIVAGSPTANASNIKLNPDGSATVKTTVVFDQTIPGFSSAIAQSNADIESSKRIGGP